MSMKPGDLIGGYRLIERLGEGGMGEVWRARHQNPRVVEGQGGDVAIKLIHGHYARNDKVRGRFHREVEIGLSLRHPSIVRSYGLVESGDDLGLVMEHVPGQTLDEWLHGGKGPIPWIEARPIFDQLLDALEYAHLHGVIHRDMKPSNVMRCPDGRIRVLDFGIARRRDSKITDTRSGMGTVDYMAPEQYTHAKSVDARADVYALGMTLYQMLAGRLPWDRSSTEFDVLVKKSKETLPPPTRFYPHIPTHVVQAIQACIHPDRDDRPPDVPALRRLLESGQTLTLKPKPDPAPRPHPPERALDHQQIRLDFAKSEGHIRAYGLWFILRGAVALLGALVLAGACVDAMGSYYGDAEVLGLMALGAMSLGVVQVMAGAKLRSSLSRGARVWVLLVSILSLLNVPFGTAVGAWGIYVLLNSDAQIVFSDNYAETRALTPEIPAPTSPWVWWLLGLTVAGLGLMVCAGMSGM